MATRYRFCLLLDEDDYQRWLWFLEVGYTPSFGTVAEWVRGNTKFFRWPTNSEVLMEPVTPIEWPPLPPEPPAEPPVEPPTEPPL
ncbi:hypothetical protein H6G93_09295 [Nostoc sp. FACHB-973]|nr:hypothetical protein [Nostoc sp. FACHB-973]